MREKKQCCKLMPCFSSLFFLTGWTTYPAQVGTRCPRRHAPALPPDPQMQPAKLNSPSIPCAPPQELTAPAACPKLKKNLETCSTERKPSGAFLPSCLQPLGSQRSGGSSPGPGERRGHPQSLLRAVGLKSLEQESEISQRKKGAHKRSLFSYCSTSKLFAVRLSISAK